MKTGRWYHMARHNHALPVGGNAALATVPECLPTWDHLTAARHSTPARAARFRPTGRARPPDRPDGPTQTVGKRDKEQYNSASCQS